MNLDKNLAELLITKICHDLSSPISAVSNGVEFLYEARDEEIAEKAKSLITINAAQVIAKLNFFRFVYGVSRTTGEFDFKELQNLISEYYKNSKATIVWPKYKIAEEIINLSIQLTQAVANLICVSASSLISEGEVIISISHDKGHKHIKITTRANNIKPPKYLNDLITSDSKAELKLENIQACLACESIKKMGGTIAFQELKNEFTIEVMTK